jgi:creatinine amidohydrolase/Fe(II)-dependent formamide hydrolase-like protein
MSSRGAARAAAGSTEKGRLEDLIVFDSLEIGPVAVEPRRVVTTYTVRRNHSTESTKLIYRFEEDVFDDTPASRNLAAMVTAQVALNYGLFCRRIAFHGPYDEHDRRFLEIFAENTAREIYVNKFLMDNPFLVGPLKALPPQPRKRYLNARIECPAEDHAPRGESDPTNHLGWSVDSSRHAVLSSGGKDSLVTLGILRELGHEVHPIFVNESGRHWYTALNGYRHLKANHPETARVWTNSDRVFAWMLRQLPFVRRDFASVRSDEYPIRLWTVAVFVFAALPLLRKRGIGRLLIGNEHDTTTKTTHQGISHYSALYDQSRYFDEELTRYYQRKGWYTCQFSILRPLSELLVEKVLAERYPDLLRHQMSCHATHIEKERVRPCGSCEKCRRIVGMLTAIGADPSDCGYTAEQTSRCLEDLAAKGAHQEPEGVEQLAHMLSEKGIAAANSRLFRPRRHPEVLCLRFHARRSPVEAIPRDLRQDVYRLLLEHAEGAVIRNGRVWQAFDANSDGVLTRPYPFERRHRKPAGRSETGPEAGRGGTRYLLGELTWPEAESRFKQVDIALLPVGAVEQHGPHLPLDTDAFDADYLARRVAEACSSPRPLVLPPIAYGVSYHHRDFSGTLSVNPETQAHLVYEIGMSAARCGITKLVMINGHGGNAPALHLAAQMINRDAHIFTCVDTGETSDTDIDELVDTPNDVHAGEIETSTALAVRPHLVDMKRAPRMVPRFSSRYLDFTSKRSVSWYAYTERLSKSGVMGDATKATAEKGERIWAVMTRRLVELVEDLKRLSLDEIYQRRY